MIMEITDKELELIFKNTLKSCYVEKSFLNNICFYDEVSLRNDLMKIETKYLKRYYNIKKSKSKLDLINKIINL